MRRGERRLENRDEGKRNREVKGEDVEEKDRESRKEMRGDR